MYPDVTKRMFEYWIEHACLFWDGSADIDLGLPASMIKLMGMGKAIALDEIESWERFTKQDKDPPMAINTVVARGKYWVWCPHSTTTLSLSSCPASCAGPVLGQDRDPVQAPAPVQGQCLDRVPSSEQGQARRLAPVHELDLVPVIAIGLVLTRVLVHIPGQKLELVPDHAHREHDRSQALAQDHANHAHQLVPAQILSWLRLSSTTIAP